MKRPKNSTIVISFLIFLFALIWLFPYQNLRGFIFGKVYQFTGITLYSESLSPTFFGFPGIKLRNVSATIPLLDQDLDLHCEKVTLRVGLSGFFPPIPSASFSLDTLQKGGDLYLKTYQSNDKVHALVELDKVNLENFPIAALGEPIQGKVDADGVVDYFPNDLTLLQGNFEIKTENFKFPALNIQGFVLPAFPLGVIAGKIQAKNGVLEISNLQIGSPQSDFKGTISGDLKLNRTLMGSFLNLTVRLQLSDKFKQDPKSETIVSMLKTFQSTTNPSEYAFKWSATLYDISNNLYAMIPQKL